MTNYVLHGKDKLTKQTDIAECPKDGVTWVASPAVGRTKFVLNFPVHKRIWRLLMLLVRGWCYYD